MGIVASYVLVDVSNFVIVLMGAKPDLTVLEVSMLAYQPDGLISPTFGNESLEGALFITSRPYPVPPSSKGIWLIDISIIACPGDA